MIRMLLLLAVAGTAVAIAVNARPSSRWRMAGVSLALTYLVVGLGHIFLTSSWMRWAVDSHMVNPALLPSPSTFRAVDVAVVITWLMACSVLTFSVRSWLERVALAGAATMPLLAYLVVGAGPLSRPVTAPFEVGPYVVTLALLLMTVASQRAEGSPFLRFTAR